MEPQSEMISFDKPGANGAEFSSQRPTTSSGRKGTAVAKESSEFRKSLERDLLPIAIVTHSHNQERVVTWTSNLEQLDLPHLLPICMSGLQEPLEPYAAFAFNAIMDLLEIGANDKRVVQILPHLMQQIKMALGTRDKPVVHRVLLVLQQLVVCEDVGEALTDYYRSILPLCNLIKDKHLGIGDELTASLVAETLETIAAYGVEDSEAIIAQYVPSFQSRRIRV